MRARSEACVPLAAVVELAQQHEQLIGHRMEVRGQRGDAIRQGQRWFDGTPT
jgi:hypothetical protein